jgi:hypothetical protein
MAKKKREPADRAIVLRFVGHLVENGYPDLKIDHWLEDEQPGQSVVEAIAGEFAIEHTSVDTLPNQRGAGHQFQKALGFLEFLPVAARLQILIPYELVQVGGDWQSHFLALASWVVLTAPTLPDGNHQISIPGTALECVAVKDSAMPAKVVLYRPAPDDDTLPLRVGEQITRKMEKLVRYKAEGHTTVLILETQDNALMNQHKMLEAARMALGGQMPSGLDRLWYAEAGGHVFFDFTGPITAGHDIIE